jgi:hypothetical protein
MGEEHDVQFKGQSLCPQQLLSIHGRARPIDQVDQSLLEGPPTQDHEPAQMSVLMDLEEQYSRSTSKPSESRYTRRGSTRRSTQRNSYRGVQRRPTTERVTYKRVPNASGRRTTDTCTISDHVTMPEHKFDETAEAPGLVAGIVSMLNLRDSADQQKKAGYSSIMDTECVVQNRRARSRPNKPFVASLSAASTRVGTEGDLDQALEACDDIMVPKELVPVPPSEPPTRTRMLRQQSEPCGPESSRIKVALQAKHFLETADEDKGIFESPAGIRTLRQQSEPCGSENSRIKVPLEGKHFVETVDEDSPFADLQEYNGTCSQMTFVPVSPSAPAPLDRPRFMHRQLTH